jgi:SP family arabinose:H+ symporter-like MFS transporter
MICPVYIAEMAPPKWRGRLGTLFQMGIVGGIFITLFINLLLKSPDDAWNISTGWRWMLATEVIPAFLFLIMLVPTPESPHWLIQVKREDEAKTILSNIGGNAYAEEEVASVRKELSAETGLLRDLFSRKFAIPSLIALVLMAGSQLSGINVIMYYSTEIFKAATGNENAAFMASVWIGLTNVIATLVAIAFVDKLGRKPLLLVGNAIQVVALATVGFVFAKDPHSPLLLAGVITYVGAFAAAMGPLPWVVCSEIFPAKLRGKAMSFSTFIIWTAALIVSQTFPQFKAALGAPLTFGFYAACSALTFLFVLILLPETKGRTIEEIASSWAKK